MTILKSPLRPTIRTPLRGALEGKFITGLQSIRPLDAALFIDMDTQEIFRDGSLRAFSDLTNVTGSQYNLDLDTGLAMHNSSGYVEISVPATPTLDKCAFTMSNGVSDTRFELFSNTDGTTKIYNSGQATFVASTFVDGGGGNSEFGRYRVYWNFNGSATDCFNGYSDSNTGAAAVAMNLMDEIGIGWNRQFAGFVYDGTVHKICIFQIPKTNAELLELVQKDLGYRGFHWLGDSWLNLGKIRNEFDRKIVTRGLHAFTSEDQIGSTSLTQQAVRHASNTGYHNQNLIIMDGGLTADDSSVAALQSIKSSHNNNRILYIQSNPVDATGVGTRPDWDDEDTAIRAEMGDYYLEILPALQAANDGSANDLADVANDIIPRSLRVDSVHINSAGDEIVADLAFNRVISLGWLP